MKVLVTGSSGRIGQVAVEALLARGDQVSGLDRVPSGRWTARGYSEHAAALQDAATAARGVDAVLHLGAFMSWNENDREKMFRSNVNGTRAVLEAALEAGAKRFVFASSGEVYPENAPLSEPITEDHPLKPNSFYGLTKVLGEELVRFFQRSTSMETVILRFAHTQNADELLDENSPFSGPRFFFAARIRQQISLGNLEAADLLKRRDPGRPAHILARSQTGRPYRMHITDTRDIVSGLLLALDHPLAAGGTFNLGSTDPVRFDSLLAAMSGITKLPVVAVDLPGPGVSYATSNARIRNMLGYAPEWTIERMLAEAETAWNSKAGHGG